MDAAWDVLVELAFRLNDQQARRLGDAASLHPCWNEMPETPNHVVPVRQAMLRAIARSARGMKRHTAAHIAKAVIPLATDRKQHLDYADAIECLCQLANRGGSRLSAHLGRLLYPKNTPLGSVLLQVAHIFDKPFADSKKLSKFAEQVRKHLGLQVQHVSEQEQARAPSGTIFTITAPQADGKFVVHMVQMIDLVAILRHRAALPKKALNQLIDATLEMIQEPENVLANKIGMTQAPRASRRQM